MKILKIYLEIIAEAFERSWSLTGASEQNGTTQSANDSAVFSDDDFNSSFLQLSDGDSYGCLICKLFLKDCFVDLLQIHLSTSCHPPAVGSIEMGRSLPKLARLVALMLSSSAENLVNRLSLENKQRVEISEHYGGKLLTLLEDVERKGFVCSADFVDVMSSFVPLMSPSVLLRLMIVLLQLPEDCVEQLDDGSRTLSDRGKLVVRVLPCIVDHVDSIQSEILTGISERLCTILKLVPSDEVVCESLSAVAKKMPQFAWTVTQGVVTSLLKAGTPPSLNLMTALAVDNENCKQLMIGWFSAHKTWSREQYLPLYVDAILFVLKACQKGLMLYMLHIRLIFNNNAIYLI